MPHEPPHEQSLSFRQRARQGSQPALNPEQKHTSLIGGQLPRGEEVPPRQDGPELVSAEATGEHPGAKENANSGPDEPDASVAQTEPVVQRSATNVAIISFIWMPQRGSQRVQVRGADPGRHECTDPGRRQTEGASRRCWFDPLTRCHQPLCGHPDRIHYAKKMCHQC